MACRWGGCEDHFQEHLRPQQGDRQVRAERALEDVL